MAETPRLRLGLQKKGRLSEDSEDLIKACGIRYGRSALRLTTSAYNFPLDLFFLRDDDIPRYVADGTVDLGIVGENLVAEEDPEVEVVEPLGFSKCRLSIAVPRDRPYNGPQDLANKRIATSYPTIVRKFLAAHGISARIHEISGSVEIAPTIGLTDAICDLVSTGSTLLGNGLREVEVVMKSQAVLIAHPNLSAEKRQVLADFRFRVQSVLTAKNYKYIMLNAPDSALEEILACLPGLKRPTVVPLGETGWCSFQSVVEENDFWGVVERLRTAGATGILVMPIEKMIA